MAQKAETGCPIGACGRPPHRALGARRVERRPISAQSEVINAVPQVEDEPKAQCPPRLCDNGCCFFGALSNREGPTLGSGRIVLTNLPVQQYGAVIARGHRLGSAVGGEKMEQAMATARKSAGALIGDGLAAIEPANGASRPVASKPVSKSGRTIIRVRSS